MWSGSQEQAGRESEAHCQQQEAEGRALPVCVSLLGLVSVLLGPAAWGLLASA